MSLIKRDPRSTFSGMIDWPDDRIDRTFREMFREFLGGGAMLDRLTESMSHLHLEEFLDGQTCVIRAEMPGIDPAKDVDITVQNGILDIRAKREEKKEDERPDGYRSEFRYGSFRRTLRLPDGATESDVKATYKDGILEIRVPIAAEPPAKTQVPITRP